GECSWFIVAHLLGGWDEEQATCPPTRSVSRRLRLSAALERNHFSASFRPAHGPRPLDQGQLAGRRLVRRRLLDRDGVLRRPRAEDGLHVEAEDRRRGPRRGGLALIAARAGHTPEPVRFRQSGNTFSAPLAATDWRCARPRFFSA